jgi:taurine dioxygenase
LYESDVSIDDHIRRIRLSHITRIKEPMNDRLLAPFGIEVSGVAIANLDDHAIDQLKDRLAHHGVIVLRQQCVDDAAFVGWLRRFGPITFTVGETPVAHQPLLNVVSNVGRTRSPRSVFHTDTSYWSQPPAFTALRAVTIPASGGETLFSDQYRAYDTLPRSVKADLAEAQVLHRVSGLTLAADQESQSWHRLFRRHPLSDRLALFLSTPERCQAIAGVESAAGARMIRLLYRHSIRPHRLYRHQWQPDDIVIWDNRCTMHRADHSKVVGDRVLHRGLVLAT